MSEMTTIDGVAIAAFGTTTKAGEPVVLMGFIGHTMVMQIPQAKSIAGKVASRAWKMETDEILSMDLQGMDETIVLSKADALNLADILERAVDEAITSAGGPADGKFH